MGNINAGRPSPVGMCTAPAGGSPNGAAADQCANAPATLSQGGAAQQGAGNPIHLANGNKYQREVDFPALSGELGIEWVRHYNSEYARPEFTLHGLGLGWRSSYDTRLVVVKNTL